MTLTRRSLLAGTTITAASLPLTGSVGAKPAVPTVPQSITINSFPINRFLATDDSARRFGMLEFRSGLELKSDYRGFGGLSALRYAADGSRLTAITDNGVWFTAAIRRENEMLAGLTDATMAAIVGPGGQMLVTTRDWDSEGLAIDGGTAYVSVERTNRIFRFNLGRDGLRAVGTPVPVPPGVKELRGNRGLEALCVFPKDSPYAGRLIAIAERGLIGEGNIPGFILGGDEALTFTVRRTNDFDVTDADFLPNGDLLILERWFSPLRGLGMRIRRIDKTQIRPGAVLDGPIVISADFNYQIDNMEGISVWRNAAGETMIALISDDNFSLLQRTLLLEFAYKP